MIHFEWLWAFLFLPLPFFIYKFFPPYLPIQQAALKIPFVMDIPNSEEKYILHFNRFHFMLASIAWVLLIFACARPQWLGEPIEQAVSGRDLMLAVDLSESMNEEDFVINNKPIDRLSAAKSVAREFINRRVGDRIGLILFGTNAYLQTPLTFDRKTVISLLDEAVTVELTGKYTAIGDAIGLAIKRLSHEKENSRVIILMTDGANTAGEVSPLKAAELAATKKLKIYTIGIGADEMLVRSFFGTQKVNPSADLDEKTLIKMAELTGGHYYRARNIDELNNIYLRLDELEPIEKDKQYFRPHTELYVYPLAVSLLITTIIALLKITS